MPDSVGNGGFPNNINIGHEHLDLITGFTYQYQGGVYSNILNWKIIGGVSPTDPSTVGWSTNQLGSMWYNSNERVYKYWNGTSIQSLQPAPPLYNYRRRIALQDDFITGVVSSGTIGVLGWFLANGTTSSGSFENAPGVITRTTGVTPTTVAYMILAGSQTILPLGISKSLRYIIITVDSDNETTLRIGATNSFTASQPGTGIYFEKLPTDTTWFAVCRNASSETRVNTNIIAAPNTTFEFRIEMSINNTEAMFFVNGNAVASIQTNLPIAAFITPGMHVVNSAGTSKSLAIDYFEMVLDGLAR